MILNEIFSSIDGEGLRQGELATFLRFAGCNLKCSYCDTEYAQEKSNGNEKSIEDIFSIVAKLKNKNITITGGASVTIRHDNSCKKISRRRIFCKY